MLNLIEEYTLNKLELPVKQKPYVEEVIININKKYNPEYGDSRICICNHTYDRHFDSYDDMKSIGCKYCQCYNFEEKIKT